MTIPYTFGGATTAIPLSNLDANFASPITLGNVAMTLSNTYTSIGNLTLTNVTVSSGNVAVTNANVTTLTVGGSTQNQQLGQGNASIMKNRIINGAMVIDQRNAGASITPAINTAVYSVDRFYTYQTQASKFTIQQNAGSVTPPTGFSKYLGITSSSAYSIASGDLFFLSQSIEGFNTADLGWGTASAKTVTLSFQVYSSLTGTFGGSIANGANSRSYPFTYSIPVANTWTTISVTIAGDTTGTWVGATNGIGMSVYFGFGVGSTYSGTAGSWAGADYRSATGATSVVGTNGATFYITGVQLEVGSSATGFEYRQYQQELALCQRYLPKWYVDASGGNQHIGSLYWQNGQLMNAVLVNPVTTRVSPTGIVASGTFYAQANASAYILSTPTFNGASPNTTLISTNSSPATLSAGFGGSLFLQGAASYIYGTGCEL